MRPDEAGHLWSLPCWRTRLSPVPAAVLQRAALGRSACGHAHLFGSRGVLAAEQLSLFC